MNVSDPNISFRSHGLYRHSLGFGFDAVNNDYEIVSVVYLAESRFNSGLHTLPPLVEIFLLRSGSWHNVSAPGPNYIIYKHSSHAFVNGACHWMAHSHRRKGTFVNVIVSFDLENEISSEMKVPESLVEENGLTMVVTVFGGSLVLLPYLKCSGRYSVWVMEEYRAAESWTKLCNIDLDEELQRVVAFRRNGEVLVVTENWKLLSYNPKNQKYSDLGISVNPCSFYINTYVESLVLLNEANGELRDQASSSDTDDDIAIRDMFYLCEELMT